MNTTERSYGQSVEFISNDQAEDIKTKLGQIGLENSVLPPVAPIYFQTVTPTPQAETYPKEIVMLADYLCENGEIDGSLELLDRYDEIGDYAVSEAIVSIHAVIQATHIEQGVLFN